MLFKVIRLPARMPTSARSAAFLLEDNWDDRGQYRTQFQLIIFDAEGVSHRAGEVKIGHIGLQPSDKIQENSRAPKLDDEFETLPANYFSLGQNENYYETLNKLGVETRDFVLTGLRDLAVDIDRLKQLEREQVVSVSLLREVSVSLVESRLRRVARGGALLTNFRFTYDMPADSIYQQGPPSLAFRIRPHSHPPTNVHVLIGRNGAGKTTCMQGIGKALLREDPSDALFGMLRSTDALAGSVDFSGLVVVAFSAFDQLLVPGSRQGLMVRHVGLRSVDKDGIVRRGKTLGQLATEFVTSLENCSTGPRADRWQHAIGTLANDPLFDEANVRQLLQLQGPAFKREARKLFLALSSGHKIVLLTVTRLVEWVDERTLVLLDEPEGHLHPPLLSAFIRALTDLLIQRNGVAIVATHSPVVLQEVPSSCVWMLRRNGQYVVAERPTIETFGENVGVLTREVFGLEVTNAGFHKMLKDDIYKQGLNFEGVLEKYGQQLGAEAMAIARGLEISRSQET